MSDCHFFPFRHLPSVVLWYYACTVIISTLSIPRLSRAWVFSAAQTSGLSSSIGGKLFFFLTGKIIFLFPLKALYHFPTVSGHLVKLSPILSATTAANLQHCIQVYFSYYLRQAAEKGSSWHIFGGSHTYQIRAPTHIDSFHNCNCQQVSKAHMTIIVLYILSYLLTRYPWPKGGLF